MVLLHGRLVTSTGSRMNLGSAPGSRASPTARRELDGVADEVRTGLDGRGEGAAAGRWLLLDDGLRDVLMEELDDPGAGVPRAEREGSSGGGAAHLSASPTGPAGTCAWLLAAAGSGASVEVLDRFLPSGGASSVLADENVDRSAVAAFELADELGRLLDIRWMGSADGARRAEPASASVQDMAERRDQTRTQGHESALSGGTTSFASAAPFISSNPARPAVPR